VVGGWDGHLDLMIGWASSCGKWDSKGIALRAITHLSRDETAAKMGYPVPNMLRLRQSLPDCSI
jgi:hypothetical protein